MHAAGRVASTSRPPLSVKLLRHWFLFDSDALPLAFFIGEIAVVSVYCHSRCTSPLEAAVAVMARKVAGTKYSRAGCPSFVIALAAKATPSPTT